MYDVFEFLLRPTVQAMIFSNVTLNNVQSLLYSIQLRLLFDFIEFRLEFL